MEIKIETHSLQRYLLKQIQLPDNRISTVLKYAEVLEQKLGINILKRCQTILYILAAH